MGSGASNLRAPIKPLQCPENYDEDDFAKILRLYNRLDVDGNMVVEQDELGQLAAHHVNNKQRTLQIKLNKNEALRKQALLQLKVELEQNKKNLETRYEEKIKLETTLSENNKKLITKEINELKRLTNKQKKEMLLLRITDSNNDIKFWKFFDYMKSRVVDIDNICWSPIKCNNYRKSSLSVSISNNNK